MAKPLILLLITAALLFGCDRLPFKKSGQQDAVARVYDKYLYFSEIEGLVPPGTAAADSIDITTAYINNWVRQELLLRQALDNIDESHTDFAKQIEQYKNSLIIYAYESELVRQKLDTVVPMSEIEKYYNDNAVNFQLRENIVLADYVVIAKNSPAIPRIKTLLQSQREADRVKLQELCIANNGTCNLNNGNWIPFAEFTRRVPVSVDNPDEFLSRNKNFVVQDSTTAYVVAIEAYKNKEAASPLSFEIPNIRAIIINKRKAEMLKRMEDDLYNDAIKRNKYEIYKK